MFLALVFGHSALPPQAISDPSFNKMSTTPPKKSNLISALETFQSKKFGAELPAFIFLPTFRASISIK